MGLFSKKPKWDMELVAANKAAMRRLFNTVVPDGDSYRIGYGVSTKITSLNFVLVTTTKTSYASLIVGWRESDMSIVILQTTPELDECAAPEFFKKDEIKKAKIVQGDYCIYRAGGMMAGYIQFGLYTDNNEDYVAYIYQPEEWEEFDSFWKRFAR